MNLLTWLFQNHFWPTWWLILLMAYMITEVGGHVLIAFARRPSDGQ